MKNRTKIKTTNGYTLLEDGLLDIAAEIKEVKVKTSSASSSSEDKEAHIQTTTKEEVDLLSDLPAKHMAEDASPLTEPRSLPLSRLIIKSTLTDNDATKQAANILHAFNSDVRTSAITTTIMWGRGERLDPNEFLLVHRNKVAEIAYSKERLALVITGPLTKVARINTVKQNEAYFGAYGKHVFNVPKGQYAKIWRGNQPILLDEGPHVIHDTTLRFTNNNAFDPAIDFITQNPASNYINHGSLHILRVPPGQIAKIVIEGVPYLLKHKTDPYAFDIQNFRFDGLVLESTLHIEHGNIHLIRVPQGKFAKITVAGEAIILSPKVQPYEFNTPFFAWNGIVDQADNYIGHGNNHILRVPPGYVAKVIVDGEPLLLESRKEFYEFNTWNFKLVGPATPQGINCFDDATSRLIINGNLKRLIPRSGEVAITHDNGQLKIIKPSNNAQPILINSATHNVNNEFLTTSIRTLMFPSQAAKMRKKKDQPHATDDEIAHIVCSTRDALLLGLQLMVAVEIVDPEIALRKLQSEEGILEHIEGCCVADIGRAIQPTSSQEFLSCYQTKPRQTEKEKTNNTNTTEPSAPPFLTYQDQVKNQLCDELREYGITLVRFNIEAAKVLDKGIANAMAAQSVETAKAGARQSGIAANYDIAVAEANQKAEVARIAQDRENASKLQAARADFEALRLRKTADKEAEKQVLEITNQLEIAKAQNALKVAELNAAIAKIEAEVEDYKQCKLGERWQKFPELLQYEMLKCQASALEKTNPTLNFSMTSQEILNASGNPFLLFSNAKPLLNLSKEQSLAKQNTVEPAVALDAPQQVLRH